MNINDFNKAQRLVTQIEYVDSILKYKSFDSLMVIPDAESLKSVREPVKKTLVCEKELQAFIRNSIEAYKVHLISKLEELGVEYE